MFFDIKRCYLKIEKYINVKLYISRTNHESRYEKYEF